jgi:hypothetical protein
MLSVLAIVIALFLLCALLALLGAVVFRGSGISFRGWRWHPNMLGITVVALAGALVLWRIFPELLFIPIILPLFWFGRRGQRGPRWTVPHREPPAANDAEAGAIDAQYRRIEDDKPALHT